MHWIHPGVALSHRGTLPAAERHDMLHGHALVHQAGSVGMAELVGVDMVGTDLFCRRDQGFLDIDRGDHDGTRLAVIRPNDSFLGMTTMALEPLMAAAKAIEESGKAGSHRYDPELFRFGLVYIQSASDGIDILPPYSV